MKIAFLIGFYLALLPEAWQSAATGSGGSVMGISPRQGSLAAALIAMSVTGQKYHDRLHGSSQYSPTMGISETDIYRSHLGC